MSTEINVNTLCHGEIFHNDNGDDYVVIGKNPEKDYTLLMKVSHNPNEKPYYLVAYGIRKGSWCQGHYFLSNFKNAINFMEGGD